MGGVGGCGCRGIINNLRVVLHPQIKQLCNNSASINNLCGTMHNIQSLLILTHIGILYLMKIKIF